MTATLIQNQTSGILLKNISWKTYESLLNEIGEHGGISLTYDRGNLEIMTPSAPHEKSGELLGNFVEVLTDELNVDICSLGSLTCKREDLERGLEPDKCYYIQNEDVVWNKEQIDLNEDPPPDLAIEIDITSSSIDRLELYASLGVTGNIFPKLHDFGGIDGPSGNRFGGKGGGVGKEGNQGQKKEQKQSFGAI